MYKNSAKRKTTTTYQITGVLHSDTPSIFITFIGFTNPHFVLIPILFSVDRYYLV